MKVCIFDSLSSIHCQRWLMILKKYSNHIYVLSFDQINIKGIEVIQIKDYNLLKSIPFLGTFIEIIIKIIQVRRIVKNIDPDIVHANYASNYGFLAACLNFRPFILTTHGSDLNVDYFSKIISKKMIEFAFKKADLVTVPSNDLFRKFSKIIGKSKTIQFQYGFDSDLYNIDNKNDYTTPHILSTRHLLKKYNLKILFYAISEIFSSNYLDNLLLYLAGIPEMREYYIKLSNNLKIHNQVQILGLLNSQDLSQLMRDTNIYVSTSPSEGLSISLLEALASGMIPVVPNIPPNQEIISKCKVGYLYEISDQKDLEYKLLQAIKNLKKIEERKSQAKYIQKEWNMYSRIEYFIKTYYPCKSH